MTPSFEGPDSFSNSVHDEMLCSVFLMRRLSMFCSILSFVYLTLFFVVHDIAVIHYLPALWAVSTVAMTCNFVRNRQFIHRHTLSLSHCVIARIFTLRQSTADWKEKVIPSKIDGDVDDDDGHGHYPKHSVVSPTVRERGGADMDAIDMDAIDEASGSFDSDCELMVSDGVSVSVPVMVEELDGVDCIGTKASDCSLSDAVLSPFPELEKSVPTLCDKAVSAERTTERVKGPTISITAPVRRRSATMQHDVECRVTPTDAVRPHSLRQSDLSLIHI